MSKKINLETKLLHTNVPKPTHKKVHEKLGLLKSKKLHPGSFRLTNEDMIILNEIVKKVNANSKGKVNKTKVFQALLRLGNDTEPSVMIEYVRNLI